MKRRFGLDLAFRTVGRRRDLAPHVKFRNIPKLHVWAATGCYFKAQLYFFTQNMDAKLYQTIIEARLSERKFTYARDCPRGYRGAWVYLQDNDPKHKAASMLERKLGDRIIRHSPDSPDLNIMEDPWSI